MPLSFSQQILIKSTHRIVPMTRDTKGHKDLVKWRLEFTGKKWVLFKIIIIPSKTVRTVINIMEVNHRMLSE